MSHPTSELPEGTHIMVDENGKYLWHATVDLRKNPTVAILLMKTMGVIIGVSIAVFIGIGLLSSFNRRQWEMLLTITGGCLLIVFGISAIIVWLYLRSLKGSYSADYVMDETGVLFRPGSRELALSRDVAVGAALVSAMAGNLGVTAASIASMDSDSVSVFRHVYRVKGIRRHCCIKVSSPLLYNQVYVAPGDYDFVYQFIAAHCTRARCVEV